MKKRFKLSLVTILTAMVSTIGLISIGFATWTINFDDNANVEGSIIGDTFIAMHGFRVKSYTTFDYGAYSFGDSATFDNTGEITYTIGIIPNQLDLDVKTALTTGGKSATFYGKFNSLYGVFDAFVGATWGNTNTVQTYIDANDYCFSFVLSGTADISNVNSTVEIEKDLTFTFSNKILAKRFGANSNLTIADNQFTLTLGKVDFGS